MTNMNEQIGTRALLAISLALASALASANCVTGEFEESRNGLKEGYEEPEGDVQDGHGLELGHGVELGLGDQAGELSMPLASANGILRDLCKLALEPAIDLACLDADEVGCAVMSAELATSCEAALALELEEYSVVVCGALVTSFEADCASVGTEAACEETGDLATDACNEIPVVGGGCSTCHVGG